MGLRILLFTFAVLATHPAVYAKHVSRQMAETVAINFFKLTTSIALDKDGTTINLDYARIETDNSVDFYVFGLSSTGFVIVTGNDNLTPIIGYSTESTFYQNYGVIGMQDWMNNTAKKIAIAAKQNNQPTEKTAALWNSYLSGTNPVVEKNSAIGPLLTSTWDQQTYYNKMCPYNTSDKERCVTGCVATSMAQIMKYWGYPSTGSGSFSYNDTSPAYSHNYGVQAADFGNASYSWQDMPNTLYSDNIDVATLMYHCGVSVAMDYGDYKEGGSGAYVIKAESGGRPSAQNAYVNYFSYNPTSLKGVFAANYTNAAWVNLLKDELKAGRPVQYEGMDPKAGGHAWVCDGYDAQGLFHMNWGWGGHDNGFFSLDSLAVAGVNLSSSEAALVGIEPLKSGITEVESYDNNLSFKMYPNPSSQYIIAEYTSASIEYRAFHIYNMAGKKVFEQQGASVIGLNTCQINIDKLNSGFYMLELELNGEIKRQKFAVSK